MAFVEVEIPTKPNLRNRPKGITLAATRRKGELLLVLAIDPEILAMADWAPAERLQILRGFSEDLGKLLLTPTLEGQSGPKLTTHYAGQKTGRRQLRFPVWSGLTKDAQYAKPVDYEINQRDRSLLITLPPWAPHMTPEAAKAASAKARIAEVAARHPAPRLS